MELIAKVKMDKNEYIIFQKNKKIHFARKEKNGITFKLNIEEEKDLADVYKRLLINKEKSRKVGETTVNERKYNIFLDFSTGNFYFENNENKLLNIPEDNRILNLKYNDTPLVIYKKFNKKENIDKKKSKKEIEDDEDLDEDEKITFNKVFTLKYKIIIVTLSSTIALNLLLPATVVSFVDKATKVITSISEDEEYDFEKIREAIESNNNLTEEEKEFILKTEFIFDENYEYMNLSSVIEKLSKLKITYSQEESDEVNSLGKTQGQYLIGKNEIVLYGIDSFDDIINNGVKTEIFLHELFHVYQSYTGFSYIIELSNEAFTREAINRMCEMGLLDKETFNSDLGYVYGTGYSILMEQFYYFAELLTQEELKELQFNNGPATTLNLIMSLDTSSNIKDRNTNAVNLYTQFQELNNISDKEQLLEKIESIRESINYYYKKQKNVEIGEDLQSFIIYNLTSNISNENLVVKRLNQNDFIGNMLIQETEELQDVFSESNPYKDYYKIECKYIPKAYFSSEYPAIIYYKVVLDENTINRRKLLITRNGKRIFN